MLMLAAVMAQEPVVYAQWGARALHADLFLPTGDGPFPAIVYVHGGGWRGGNRNQFHRHAARLAELGFVGLCIEYRFQQEAKWPAAMDDVAAALTWFRTHARQYKIDLTRLGAAGGSAGGHLAAMLGVRAQVKAVAAFNPALDLVALAGQAPAPNSVSDFLGATYAAQPARWKEASPIEHISAKSAAFLFLHGDADTTVPYAHTVRMHHLLRQAGVHSDLYTAPNAAHGFFNRDPEFQPTLARLEKFFLATLGR
jgi:acetyl esterase/lipase